MARARRGPSRPLIETLAREPFRFDSRQAVRVLDARRRIVGGPETAFRGSLSLAFPIADLESVRVPAGAAAPVVTVSFLGLGGAGGPLPPPYTEHLNAAVRRREPAGRDFLDIFNHRLVVASVALGRTFHPALQPGPPQRSSLARQTEALLGLLTPGTRAMIPDLAPALLPLAGLLGQRPLSGHAIERALTATFGLPARVRPFRGGWLRIPADGQTRIGRRGREQLLGRTATLGGRAWDQSAGIVLELGPVPYAIAEGLLPRSGQIRSRMRALLAFLVEDDLDVALHLRVDAATIPLGRLPDRGLRLGRARLVDAQVRTPRRATMRLGLTSWLERRPAAGGEVAIRCTLATRR